ncbi:hypothetical protein ABF81_12415, partial [Enterobacter hormaechei subsp. steigerwaltii]
MAATNFKPEFTVCKTESDAFTGMIENRELVRKNSARRLHGNQSNAALMNPLMILVKIIKLRWIHILSYDQMV